MNVDDILVDSLQIMNLKLGDILVLSCKERLSDDVARILREQLSAKFRGYEVLVLGSDFQLGVVRPE